MCGIELDTPQAWHMSYKKAENVRLVRYSSLRLPVKMMLPVMLDAMLVVDTLMLMQLMLMQLTRSCSCNSHMQTMHVRTRAPPSCHDVATVCGDAILPCNTYFVTLGCTRKTYAAIGATNIHHAPPLCWCMQATVPRQCNTASVCGYSHS